MSAKPMPQRTPGFSEKDILPASGITPEMMAIGELLATVKQTLKAIGTTFETTSALGPTNEPKNQVNPLQMQMAQLRLNQEAQLEQAKALLESVLKEQVSEQLKTSAHNVIQEAVEKEVKERVKDQLAKEAPAPETLAEKPSSQKRQTLEVKTSLYNSEARQYNASLRSNSGSSLTIPLRPLLRPLPTPFQSPCISTFPNPFTTHTVPPTPAIPKAPPLTPASTIAREFWLRDDDNDLEPPTPSPLFPRDLASLAALRPEDARRLAVEYGLVGSNFDLRAACGSTLGGEKTPIKLVPAPGLSIPSDAWERKRREVSGTNTPSVSAVDEGDLDFGEDALGKFMLHIGVEPFQEDTSCKVAELP